MEGENEGVDDILRIRAKRSSVRSSAVSLVARLRTRNRSTRSSALAISVSDHVILGSYKIPGDVGASWKRWTLELCVVRPRNCNCCRIVAEAHRRLLAWLSATAPDAR